MTLNSCERQFVNGLQARTNPSNAIPLAEVTLAELRKRPDGLLIYAGSPADVSSCDKKVSVRDGAVVRIRIFNDHLKFGPVLIWYPGCGYLLPVFELNAIAASRIAKLSNRKVIVVDHRLAPEHSMPGPIEDGYDVVRHLCANAGHYKIDPDQIFLGGISSGAHCAVMISRLMRGSKDGSVKGLFLINGNYDFTRSQTTHSEEERQDQLMPQAVIQDQISRLGLTEQQKIDLSPILTNDFDELPPTKIVVSEFDAVRSDSEVFAKMAAQPGNNVEKIVVQGQTHNTMLLRNALHEGPDQAEIIAELFCSACFPKDN